MGYIDQVLVVIEELIAQSLFVQENENLIFKVKHLVGVSTEEVFEILIKLSKKFPVHFPFIWSSSIGTVEEYEGIRLSRPNISSLEFIKSELTKERNRHNTIKLVSNSPELAVKLKVTKQVIFISKDRGIYISDEKQYAIKNKRSEYVWKLRDGKKPSRFLHSKPALLSKEIKEINKNCTKILGLQAPLIQSLPTGGYALNTEKFEIKFVDTGL